MRSTLAAGWYPWTFSPMSGRRIIVPDEGPGVLGESPSPEPSRSNYAARATPRQRVFAAVRHEARRRLYAPPPARPYHRGALEGLRKRLGNATRQGGRGRLVGILLVLLAAGWGLLRGAPRGAR